MARRRRKQQSVIEDLVLVPWPVLLFLAGLAYAFFAWILPAMAGSNPFLKALSQAIQALAWIPSLGLAILALVSYFVNRPIKMPPMTKPRPMEPSLPAPHANPEPSELDKAWDATIRPLAIPPQVAQPRHWTIDLLRNLEWKRFEIVCAAYYKMLGFRVETIRCGADGGIDAKLFWADEPKPAAILQCKAWNTYQVGVKPVRELLGVMAHNGVSKGIFLATGGFTREAVEFARENPIELVSGDDFLAKIKSLPPQEVEGLLTVATEGDYLTPTCPSCGIKMVKRSGSRGEFWGCRNYPRCQRRFVLRSSHASA